MNNFTDQTLGVINRHLHALRSNQGVDAIVQEYESHALLSAPDNVYRSIDEIRHFFQTFLGNLTDQGLQLLRARRKPMARWATSYGASVRWVRTRLW
jgi:hypothetical protein